MYCPFYHYKMSIFVYCYILYLEIYFFWHKYSYTCFSWMLFGWGIISTLSLHVCLSLRLRCVSFWRQHVVGFWFLIKSTTLCLYIGEFRTLASMVIIGVWWLHIAIVSFVFLVALCLHCFCPLCFYWPFEFGGMLWFFLHYLFFLCCDS